MKKPIAWLSIFATCVLACNTDSNETKRTDPPITRSPALPETPAPSPEKPKSPPLVKASNFAEALAQCKGRFDNKAPNDNADMPGAACFLSWALHGMIWKDVSVSKDETSPGLVFKNPSKELGKKICSTGTIVQIEESNDLNEGLLSGYSGTLYHFYNVMNTGTLVQGRPGRMCGIVIGTYNYSNSGGGIGHAVNLVGVWDIPENGGRGFHPEE